MRVRGFFAIAAICAGVGSAEVSADVLNWKVTVGKDGRISRAENVLADGGDPPFLDGTVNVYNDNEKPRKFSVWFNASYGNPAFGTFPQVPIITPRNRAATRSVPLEYTSDWIKNYKEKHGDLVSGLLSVKLERVHECVQTRPRIGSGSKQFGGDFIDCLAQAENTCGFRLRRSIADKRRFAVHWDEQCNIEDLTKLLDKVHENVNISEIESLVSHKIEEPRKMNPPPRAAASGGYKCTPPDAGGKLFDTTFPPNDAWGYYHEGNYALPHKLVHADEAWQILAEYPRTNQTVTAFVVDANLDFLSFDRDLDDTYAINDAELFGRDGVDDDHDGAVDNIWGLYGDRIYLGDEDPIPGPPDVERSSHGQAVASTLAGRPNNCRGTAGFAPNVRILHCGAGRTGINIWDASNCVQWLVNNYKRFRIRVSNHSYGSSAKSQLEWEVLNKTKNTGLMMVMASGNTEIDFSKSDPADWHYPFGYSIDDPDFHHIIAAPQFDTDGKPAPSGYGVPSTLFYMPGGVLNTNADGGVVGWDGTSFSSPVLSAYITAMLSVNYKLTEADLMWIMQNSVDPYDPIPKGKTRWDGIGNFKRALNGASGSWFRRADFGPWMQDFIEIPPYTNYEFKFKVDISSLPVNPDDATGNLILYIEDPEDITGAHPIGYQPVDLYG